MYQTQNTVNVEFLKSSKGIGSRVIKLNYSPNALPPQLVGRVDMNMWGAFMQECAVLAERHPYVIKPSAKQVGMWGVCFSIASVVGCAAINPDGGSYPQWEAEVSQMLARWRDSFAHSGLALSLQRTREHWIQIDIVGPPPSGPPPPQHKEGFEAQKLTDGQQGGYQPPPYQAQQPQQQQGFQPQTYQAQPYQQQAHPGQPGATY